MTHVLSPVLSFLRPQTGQLSPETSFQVRIHRLLSLLGAALVPLFGPLYEIANPGAVDPIWARLSISGLFLGLFGLSYQVAWIRARYVACMRGLLYVVLAWFITIAALNQFAGNYAVGLLLVFAVLSVVVGLGAKHIGPPLRFFGFGLGATALGGALGPPPTTSLPILLLSLGTVAVVGGIVIEAQLSIQRKLRDAKAKAEEASRLKTAMLANMSHELRTPLTSINGFAEILTENLEGQMRTFAERIYDSGQRLMETLDSVLVISRLEAGLQELERGPVRVGHVAREAAETVRPAARKKQIDLRVGIEEEVEGIFSPAGVRRIAENLVDNAVKFTPPGGEVEVRVWKQEEAAAILEVEDSGVGIEEEALPTVFEPFRQESEGLGREYEGVGLGLPIVHRLVEAQEGTIEVETEKGEGSRFTVRLPLSGGPSDNGQTVEA